MMIECTANSMLIAGGMMTNIPFRSIDQFILFLRDAATAEPEMVGAELGEAVQHGATLARIAILARVPFATVFQWVREDVLPDVPITELTELTWRLRTGMIRALREVKLAA
jgi:hypothetical protein